jgi:SET domain
LINKITPSFSQLSHHNTQIATMDFQTSPAPMDSSSTLLCQPADSCSTQYRMKESRGPRHVPQDVLYPAYTNDYRLVNGKWGLGMVANRAIKKGEMVMTDSIEFLFADVKEGDNIILVGHELASAKSEIPVPERLPITRDMLIRTHGVPVLKEDPSHPESAGIEFYRLEIPWMLLNHSCDPNCIDSSHKEPEGEAIAARDIAEGEELTYDYTHQYYESHFECLCNAHNCRKYVTGFQGLSDADKERLWCHVSDYIKVRHFADMGKGPRPRLVHPTFPERKPSPEANAVRLVVPGPSCAESCIAIAKDEKTGEYRLYAGKDFNVGEKVYSFWNFPWPEQGRVPVDMVAASNLLDGDAPEGTVIRVNPLEHGVRDGMGRIRFSCYDMLTVHSCEPNMVYNYKDEDEEDDWRATFAARPIKKGEMLSIDYNTVWWDRSEVGAGVCNCGASKCRGTMQGYCHLPKEHQDELMSLSWLRVNPPYDGETRLVTPGEALSPAIHGALRRDTADGTDATDMSVSSSSNVSTDGNSSEEE